MKRQTEIIASGIANLTDARYFAAMGVQWMTFDLRDDPRPSPELMHAIMDWVEGPDWLIEIDRYPGLPPIEGIAGYIVDHPETTGITREQIYVRSTSADDFVAEKTYLDLAGQSVEKVSNILTDLSQMDAKLWINADWTPALLQEALRQEAVSGIVFRGGSEDAVGVKDYDRLDGLFAIVESMND